MEEAQILLAAETYLSAFRFPLPRIRLFPLRYNLQSQILSSLEYTGIRPQCKNLLHRLEIQYSYQCLCSYDSLDLTVLWQLLHRYDMAVRYHRGSSSRLQYPSDTGSVLHRSTDSQGI